MIHVGVMVKIALVFHVAVIILKICIFAINLVAMDQNPLPLINKQEYSGNDVLCLHPVIIVNKQLPELLYRYRCLVVDGHTMHISRPELAYHFGYPISAKSQSYDTYKDSYVLDEYTGETFPVYLLVSCGHCECCQKAKLDSIAHRCTLETIAYNSLPWFVTLTYNNDHLPHDGVNVEDVQLFMKRLRINLDRCDYNEKIRYFCSAEYSPVGRPHYHMIFWNLHPKKNFRYNKLMYVLTKSWDLGFCYNEIVSPKYRKDGKPLGSPQKCFEYVSKYINKDCDVPEGKNPTFSTASNRGGGIGAPYLDRYVIPYVRKTVKPGFEFLNHFARIGTLQKLFFNRYVLSRCFPTFSQSCPLKLRNAYRRLLLNESRLDHKYRHAEFLAIKFTLSCHLPSPELPFEIVSFGEPACLSTCPFLRYQVDQDIKLLQEMIPKIDFKLCEELDSKRKLFVSRLTLNKKKRDLKDIAYKFRKSRNTTKALVTLPM